MAPGAEETMALPEIPNSMFAVLTFGPVDLGALGVSTAEIVFFINGIERPFINAGAVVDSVTISDVGAPSHTLCALPRPW